MENKNCQMQNKNCKMHNCNLQTNNSEIENETNNKSIENELWVRTNTHKAKFQMFVVEKKLPTRNTIMHKNSRTRS